jgi:L-lactate dehydrogenase complex protein LldG
MKASSVMDKVRAALGRSSPLSAPPIPPRLDEPLIRLVHSDFGLPELFARRAAAAKIDVQAVYVEELPRQLIACLSAAECKTIAMPDTPFLRQLNLRTLLSDAGFSVKSWSEMTLDEIYDYDCGLTDAYAAVAETGSIVIRPDAVHGRAISLVPRLHVAILQPSDFVGDLLDLFEKLTREGVGNNVTLITGPSKTSDIEMNLVVGVHGPWAVQAFVLK